MQAAHAVGDDTLQETAYGTSIPDSFTHDTSAQRKKWFSRDFQYGDLAHGDTFSGSIDKKTGFKRNLFYYSTIGERR